MNGNLRGIIFVVSRFTEAHSFGKGGVEPPILHAIALPLAPRLPPLKYLPQPGKSIQLQQLLAFWSGVDLGVFQHPGVFMKEMDSV